MIDLHYAPTPNGRKISIMLEELGLPYKTIPVRPATSASRLYSRRLPELKRWYKEVRARPQVQAGLAIGKFVKESFDEETRRNMFGQKAKEMAEKQQ
jgi:glutathione S-transferase